MAYTWRLISPRKPYTLLSWHLDIKIVHVVWQQEDKSVEPRDLVQRLHWHHRVRM